MQGSGPHHVPGRLDAVEFVFFLFPLSIQTFLFHIEKAALSQLGPHISCPRPFVASTCFGRGKSLTRTAVRILKPMSFMVLVHIFPADTSQARHPSHHSSLQRSAFLWSMVHRTGALLFLFVLEGPTWRNGQLPQYSPVQKLSQNSSQAFHPDYFLKNRPFRPVALHGSVLRNVMNSRFLASMRTNSQYYAAYLQTQSTVSDRHVLRISWGASAGGPPERSRSRPEDA